jgi:hypothetical protein
MMCGSLGRVCPKLAQGQRSTTLGQYEVPPPCIYFFPGTVPSPRGNPNPAPNELENVEILKAFSEGFSTNPDDAFKVHLTVAHKGAETVRTTEITQNGVSLRKSDPTPIKRS